MCRSALLVLASWFFVFASAPASAVEGPAGNAGSASVPGADAKGPNVEQAEPAASRADPNATRLLLGPTARSLRSGEAYFDLFTLTIPFAQVGLTDRFSVGVGAPVLIPGVIPGEVFFVTPKLQLYEGGTTALAVGVLHIHDGADNRTGIAYGVVTRGTADAAVTAGLGYGYWRSKSSDAATPVVMLGGEKRLSRSVKLITENYAIRGGGLMTGGLRLIRDRVTWDLGLGADLGAGRVLVWPVVRFSWRFSER
jgi:hypothetical protein